MGGAKKLSLAQAEKQQQMQTGKQQQQKKTTSPKPRATVEKKVGGIDLPELTEQDLIVELSKMRAITPYQVASRYNVKLGVARSLLTKMEQRGHIKMVSRNGSVLVYRTLGAA